MEVDDVYLYNDTPDPHEVDTVESAVVQHGLELARRTEKRVRDALKKTGGWYGVIVAEVIPTNFGVQFENNFFTITRDVYIGGSVTVPPNQVFFIEGNSLDELNKRISTSQPWWENG